MKIIRKWLKIFIINEYKQSYKTWNKYESILLFIEDKHFYNTGLL